MSDQLITSLLVITILLLATMEIALGLGLFILIRRLTYISHRFEDYIDRARTSLQQRRNLVTLVSYLIAVVSVLRSKKRRA